jgi:GNAT superfamily N-acetyltransferase
MVIPRHGVKPRLTFAPLSDEVLGEFTGFSCGPESYHLDLVDFLVNDALDQQNKMLSKTYAFFDMSDRPVGYTTLVAAGIESWDRKAFKYPSVSALLVGRLAVDIAQQGKGYGGAIMAWIRSGADNMITGCRFIAVHVEEANERAISFYEREGFTAAPVDPVGKDRMLLYLYDRAVSPEAAVRAGQEAAEEVEREAPNE